MIPWGCIYGKDWLPRLFDQQWMYQAVSFIQYITCTLVQYAYMYASKERMYTVLPHTFLRLYAFNAKSQSLFHWVWAWWYDICYHPWHQIHMYSPSSVYFPINHHLGWVIRGQRKWLSATKDKINLPYICQVRPTSGLLFGMRTQFIWRPKSYLSPLYCW